MSSKPSKPRQDWSKVPLGTMADAEIARRLGTSQAAVTYQRHKRGIPVFVPLPEPPVLSNTVVQHRIMRCEDLARKLLAELDELRATIQTLSE